MSQIVDLGEHYGQVAFPDSYSPEQIISEFEGLEKARNTPPTPPTLSTLDYAKNVGGRLLRGVAGMVASVPEDLAIALSGLARLTGSNDAIVGQGDPYRAEDRASYQLGQAIRRGAEYLAPTNRALDDSFLASKLPEGVGSALGFMAGGVAGKALKIPAWLAIGGLGSAASGADFYHDAKSSGADEGTAQLASVFGNVVGTSEAIPLARMLHRLDGITGNTFSRSVIEAGKDTLEEALQEGAQQLAQNFTAQQLYDKDRSLFNEVATNTGVGGSTGLLISALTQALGIPIGRSRVRREEQDQSRERIRRVIAQRESEADASQVGSQPQTPGQEAQVGQEEVGSVRLRNPTQDGLGAETGTPVTPPPTSPAPSSTLTQEATDFLKAAEGGVPAFVTSNLERIARENGVDPTGKTPNDIVDALRTKPTTQQTQGTQAAPPTATGPVAEPSTVPEVVAGITPPATDMLTQPQSVVQEAINTLFAPQPQEAPMQFVGRVVRDITSRWQNAPEIQLVHTGDQLPDEVKNDAAVAKQDINEIDAVRDSRGVVWIVSDKIRNAGHVSTVLLHEAIGHEGVDSVFGTQQDRQRFMEGVAQRHASTPLGAEIRGIYGDDPVTVGMEIVARLAEDTQADPTLWQQIVAAVRNWARKIFKVEISDNDIRVLLMKGRESVEGQPVPVREAIGGTAFSVTRPESTSYFPKRSTVIAATSNPGLTPSQIQEAEDLASVQSHMVTQGITGWLIGTPADKVEKRAQKILDYLLDRAYLSTAPRPLSSFPEGTDEETRTKQLAGSMQLAHHAVDRSVLSKINSDIDAYQLIMQEAVAKTATTTQLQHKSNFLTALFNRLTSDYKVYLSNRNAVAPASGNLAAQWRDKLNRAQERLNDHAQSPTALKNALSAIARTIPDSLLQPTSTNQDIVNWVVQQGALFNVVGQNVQDWMLVDDGTGSPALLGYTRLIEDLITLKDILTNEAAVQADIDAFEQWFKNNPVVTGGKVAPKALAEKYFAFRQGRDRALKIVSATEKIIEKADERIRANVTARDRLETMMQDPGYVAAVREARDKADIVVIALYDPNDASIPAVGLINRNKAVGSYLLKGPISGVDFAVDLHPSSAGEAVNMQNLAAWAAEARAWALGHTDSDPLLADQYNDLANYVERNLMSPSMDPRNGFTVTRVRLPFTNIRMALDPFDMITSLTGTIGYSWQTVRDVIERVGGRAMHEAFRDAHTLDTVMRKVEAIDHHPEYGRAAQTQAVLKALESHGWSVDQEKRWEEQVAEPVLASGQNRLSPTYEVNDIVVGSDVKLTAADVAALKVMKRWGDAIIAVAPHSIQDRLAELGISRRAIGNGKFTGHRIQAQWTETFFKSWNEAKDDAAKENLLSGDEEFRRVVLGYLAEFNPEFSKMNPASSDKSPLFELYRRLADTEKSGVQTFRSMAEVIDFLADEGVTRGVFPDYITAADTIHATLLTEIKDFISDFEKHVIYRASTDVYGGVPPGLVQRVSAKNAFTTPRGRLQAPSTFYTYSTATAARQQRHVGSLRSILNLKLLQSAYEATKALESKKVQMEARVKALTDRGVTASKARKQIQKETSAERELGEIRYDLREIVTALQAIEQAFFKNLERYELSTADHYEHAGVAAANTFFSAIKSSLLSSLQAMSTNYWTGGILGPALAHWQSGQFGRAMGDVVLQPAIMARTVMKRVAAMVDNNPTMHRLLRQHAPLWDDIAESVIKGAADWRRVQQIAQSSGMVNPYNLGTVLKNMSALKRTAGRFVNDDPHRLAEAVNVAMSAPGVRHATEGLKATIPRLIDNGINYLMVINWDREAEFLKKVGWAAFKVRETTAAAGANWKDLTQKANVLTPGDLGLKTNKGLEWYRQLFIPLGSLDAVLLDYYERTQGMTAEQREAEPLLNDDDHAALALQYAAKSNVSTETNRPYSLKGKGSDGVWRNIVGTFMGWPINMMHQLSKGLQTHSADKQFPSLANSMIGLATIVVLLAAVGAWNWEFGDELTKGLYDVSSARVQIGNIKDWQTGLLYFAQALVNTVPMIGSSIGGLAGVAYTGRGNPFDMTSVSPHIGFVAGIYNTVRRVAQTGDASLPLLDFARQWIPMSKIVLNRMPVVRGMVDQQNAVRSMNASAPPGTEIKWGKRGGDVKYGPANDEITKLIASAYEAARGGDPAQVQARLQDAVAAYVAAGRSPDDAMKALTSALSAKEPIRILTGREMTPEEEEKWVARMTPSQKADYDKAVAAWGILSAVTGKDFNMVTTKGQGGGGGVVSTPSRAVGLGGGPLRSGLAAGSIGLRLPTGIGLGTGLGSIRRRRTGATSRRSSSRVTGGGGGTTRRRIGPRVSTASSRRRRTIGTRRRRSYSTA